MRGNPIILKTKPPDIRFYIREGGFKIRRGQGLHQHPLNWPVNPKPKTIRNLEDLGLREVRLELGSCASGGR